MRRAFFALALLSCVLSFPVVASAQTLPWDWTLQSYKHYAEIQVGDQTLTVELADTGELQTRGLSYRDGLAPGTGMLFVYPMSENHTFWMKGMRFCLDIIWINDGAINGAAENACPEPGVADGQLARYPSSGPAQFVLEVPAGWMKEHGLGAGTPVDLSAVPVSSGLSGG
jgi:hypothetical protein